MKKINAQKIEEFTKQLKQIDFDLNSSFGRRFISLCAGVATISLASIALKIEPISRQANLWNICVEQEMNHLQIISATKAERIWLSVPNCNGNTN